MQKSQTKNPSPGVRFNRRVCTAKNSFIERARSELAALTEPEEVKLYQMALPHRGTGSYASYEMLKRHIYRTPALSAKYDFLINLVIDFLNI